MSEERFLWNKDRTEMLRAGAIRQISIAELVTHTAETGERIAKKSPVPQRNNWVVRAFFAHSIDSAVLGVFDSLEEARSYLDDLQRHAEG